MRYFSILLFLLFYGVSFTAKAQQITQTIRGTVTDNISSSPIPGATVMVEFSNPVIGTTTDENGKFRLPNVPVGKVNLIIRFTGYRRGYLSNLEVQSGKELVLNILLEEDINAVKEIEIVAETDKREPLNSMSGISTRTFSVEETQKFAAAVNDPGRMATSFAGVVSTDDGNNNISIRGNSPYGLLWRMEGIDIPNPNHFSAPATSGGGISILSAQLLSNSDFMTGAFSAEYGNALSGVFDLRLRKGNNEKREYTLQAGFLGFDAAAEGPLRKGYDGSYLINYRYSTLSLLSNMGINVGDAVTNFQDLSFNVCLPTAKAGNFSVFGFGGLSDQYMAPEEDSTEWKFESDRRRQNYYSNTGAAGIKHLYIFNEKHYLQTIILGSGTALGFIEDRYDDEMKFQEIYREQHSLSKITFSTVWNYKINAKHSVRTGTYISRHRFQLFKEYLEEGTSQWLKPLNTGNTLHTAQFFSQWKHRISERWTTLAGIHTLYLAENGRLTAEPRLSLQYTTPRSHTWSVGYGLHSQMQPLGMYYTEYTDTEGTVHRPNENLNFNQAQHWVAYYDHSINKFLHAKLEGYYQHLFNIAVEDTPNSTFSSLNAEYDYILKPMANKGSGRNYGAELTIEQFTRNGLYFLISGTIFRSEYKAMDGQWRGTRFDAGKNASVTAGKEWRSGKEGKERIWGVNMRLIYSGGLRITPIDLQASIDAGSEVYTEERAFESRMPDYLRCDLRFSVKRNRVKSTTTLALDVQNATNRKNYGGIYFDPNDRSVKSWQLVPLIPVLSYRIQF